MLNLSILRVAGDLLNWFKSAMEAILEEHFKTNMSDGSVEIDTFEEQVDFDGCSSSRRKSISSNTLARSVEMMNNMGV